MESDAAPQASPTPHVSSERASQGSKLRSPWPYATAAAFLFLCVAWLTLHLWRTFVPNYDLIWDTRNAVKVIQHGHIPAHGSVTSFFAFNPAGVTIGMLPGLLLFPTEPALAERIGSLLLLALTLTGLFLLIGKRFGYPAALGVVALYALSATGLYFADSLRPRAHPVFLVWMLYFLDRWINDKSRASFAAAVFVFIAGAVWLMEILPTALLFPIAWLIYRPQISAKPLVAVLVAGFILWLPYLIFESHRSFKDLRCIITRQYALADLNVAFRESLSNPNLATVEGRRIHDLQGGPPTNTPALEANVGPKSAEPARPEYQWVTDSRVGMCYRATKETTVEGVSGIWLCPSSTKEWWFVSSKGDRWFNNKTGWSEFGPLTDNRGWLQHIQSSASSRGPLLFAPFPECRLPCGQIVLFLFAACSFFWLAISVSRRTRADSNSFFNWNAIEQKQRVCIALFAIAAIAPWLFVSALVSTTEADFTRRFLYLWVALAGFIVFVLRQWLRNFRPAAFYAVVAALIMLVAWNETFNWKFQSLVANRFRSAPPNEFNQLVDSLAAEIKASNRTSASIGYDIPFLKWIVCAHAADHVSKIGNQYDLVLLLRHGITNTDLRAEGISPDDDFRVVEHQSAEAWRQTYFDLSSYPKMQAVQEMPNYTILRKSPQ